MEKHKKRAISSSDEYELSNCTTSNSLTYTNGLQAPNPTISKLPDNVRIISQYEVIASGNGGNDMQVIQPHIIQKTLPNTIIQPTSNTTQPNIKQKVKFVPSNQFVRIKPPPVNTQKIYVKSPNNGETFSASSLTHGEKIYSEDVTANKLMIVKNKNMSDKNLTATAYDNGVAHKSDLNNVILSNEKAIGLPFNNLDTQMTIDPQQTAASPPSIIDSDLFGTNILDIPILFADNDGNFGEDILMTELDASAFDIPPVNHDKNKTEPITDLLSENVRELTGDDIDNFSTPEPNLTNLLPTKTPETVTSKGSVVILNGNNLSRFKTVNSSMKSLSTSDAVQPIKYRKVIIPSNKSITKIPIVNNNSTFVKYGGNKNPVQLLSSITKPSQSTLSPATVSSPSSSAPTKQPIIVGMNKKHLKNIIKLPSGKQYKFINTDGSNNNVVIRQSDLHKIPAFKQRVLNRNLTVRKINVIRKPIPLKPNDNLNGRQFEEEDDEDHLSEEDNEEIEGEEEIELMETESLTEENEMDVI